MKRVHVAAAVIRGSDGRVLIARRPEDKHQGGLWEFPGGKVEDGEPVRAALARELEEELGIRVERARPLIQVRHDYADKHVLLMSGRSTGFPAKPTAPRANRWPGWSRASWPTTSSPPPTRRSSRPRACRRTT